jgi:hypothetical protein
MTNPIPEKHLERIQKSKSGCWLWTGRLMSGGYGSLSADGRTQFAHRYIYESLVGEIPKGLELDHLCRVRSCVNPEHLEPVTARENMLRSPIAITAINARKTQCPYGHEYTTTTQVAGRNKGRVQRTCLTCKRLYWKQFTAGNPPWPPR